MPESLAADHPKKEGFATPPQCNQIPLKRPRDLKASQPWPIGRGSLGPMLWVSWSDGSTSYYLDGQLTVTQED
jgi:hypothetical protein